MYFSPQVKQNKGDFFNYEVLQEELKNALQDKVTPLIVVYGLRRTGKTSLIRVVLHSLKRKYVWIDGRDIQSRADFENKLEEEVKKLSPFSIRKVSVKGLEVSFAFIKEGLDFLNKHKITLVIDEVQLLKKIHLDNTLAYIYDNYPNIKIVLSGSEVGMLMHFLGKDNAKAPLYGRAVFELQTHRLEKEGSSLFLHQGAKQAKVNLKEEEARDAINNLDGIIGWLTKYGWHRLRSSHKEALHKTIEEGKYIVKDEFLKFAVRAEKQYTRIIKAIKKDGKWEKIKKATNISDKQLYTMLKRLIAYGFVEKKDHAYSIADPLLEAAF
ncbi:MAG: ATP-binding protein [Candidatus Saganbacteria bacterium]|nr:ATP-binding protein [Candidatus Saganbacteria bacterium]